MLKGYLRLTAKARWESYGNLGSKHKAFGVILEILVDLQSTSNIPFNLMQILHSKILNN